MKFHEISLFSRNIMELPTFSVWCTMELPAYQTDSIMELPRCRLKLCEISWNFSEISWNFWNFRGRQPEVKFHFTIVSLEKAVLANGGEWESRSGLSPTASKIESKIGSSSRPDYCFCPVSRQWKPPEICRKFKDRCHLTVSLSSSHFFGPTPIVIEFALNSPLYSPKHPRRRRQIIK